MRVPGLDNSISLDSVILIYRVHIYRHLKMTVWEQRAIDHVQVMIASVIL
jgi:hypothetical protein